MNICRYVAAKTVRVRGGDEGYDSRIFDIDPGPGIPTRQKGSCALNSKALFQKVPVNYRVRDSKKMFIY